MYQYKLLAENKEDILDLMLDTYTDCFFKDNKSIIAIGDFNEIPLNKLQSKSKFVALNLIGIQFLVKYNEKEKVYKIRDTDFKDLPVPETNFVMINLNVSLLKLGLQKIKSSPLWNQGGQYTIISSSRNSCKNATTFLTIVWKFEILSVIFVCRNAIEDIQFYTYNPFTSRAPAIWTKYKTMKQNNGHTLTLFKHSYIKSEDFPLLQHHLFFDKTANLGGYPIRITKYISHSNLPYELHEYGVHVTSMIVSTIWMKLNANVSLFVYPTQQRGGIHKNGSAHGLLKNLFRGEYDMQLNLDYERDLWRNQLYTSIESGICHVAWRNMYRNNNFFLIFSTETTLMVITMSVIATMVLSSLVRVGCLQIATDLFRGILGNPMLYRPTSNSGKIAFSTCSFSFMVANLLFFQPKLLSFLAAPKYVDKLQTPYDLIDLQYKVYGESRYEQYFFDTAFQYYMKRIDSTHECLEILIAGSLKVACTCDCWAGDVFVRGYGLDKQLSLLKNKYKYFVYIVRDNFPLLNAMKCVYKKLQEGGILDYVQSVFFRVRSTNYDATNKQVFVTTFNQISVSFRWLIYGLIAACAAFLCELFIYMYVMKEVRRKMTRIKRCIYKFMRID